MDHFDFYQRDKLARSEATESHDLFGHGLILRYPNLCKIARVVSVAIDFINSEPTLATLCMVV